MNAAFAKALNIHQLATTAYSPQANGIVERMHRFLGEQLRALDGRERREWGRHVPAIMFAYRNGLSSAHGNSPYFLIHGRDPRLPEDLLDQPEADLRDEVTRARLPQLLRLRHALDRASTARKLRADDRTDHLNERRSITRYQEGELVIMHSPATPKGHNRKLHLKWRGPYRIECQLYPDVYRVTAQFRPVAIKTVTVHARRLKRIVARRMQPETFVMNQEAPVVAINREHGRRIELLGQDLDDDDIHIFRGCHQTLDHSQGTPMNNEANGVSTPLCRT